MGLFNHSGVDVSTDDAVLVAFETSSERPIRCEEILCPMTGTTATRSPTGPAGPPRSVQRGVDREAPEGDTMQIAELTPQSGSYRGNRPVCGLERVVPADWLWTHEFRADEVEVYTLGDAVVPLPSREAQPNVTVELFNRLTAGWAPVDWWRTHSG
jgi:hypothetical protein